MNKYVGALAAVLLVGGCGATGPKFQDTGVPRPGTGEATIVFYRPSSFAYGGLSPAVEVNGKVICDLPNGGMFSQVMQAGRIDIGVSLWSTPGTSRLAFDAQESETYYVRIAANRGKIFTGALVGVLVASAVSSDAGSFKLALNSRAGAEEEIVTTLQVECSKPR